MAFLVHNLPPVEVYVKKEYLYDHQKGHGELTPGIWISIRSIMGKALYFETLLTDYGALYDKLPISAFVWKEDYNKAENRSNINTAFMLIQQVTKGGEFAGSNRFKHMLTGMAHMKFDGDGGRCIFFSKNRRGGEMNKLFFSLNTANHVGWLFTEPLNMAI